MGQRATGCHKTPRKSRGCSLQKLLRGSSRFPLLPKAGSILAKPLESLIQVSQVEDALPLDARVRGLSHNRLWASGPYHRGFRFPEHPLRLRPPARNPCRVDLGDDWLRAVLWKNGARLLDYLKVASDDAGGPASLQGLWSDGTDHDSHCRGGVRGLLAEFVFRTSEGFDVAVQVGGLASSPALLLLQGQANSHTWWDGVRGAFESELQTNTIITAGLVRAAAPSLTGLQGVSPPSC